MNTHSLTYRVINSPIGKLTLTGYDSVLTSILFSQGGKLAVVDPGWHLDPDAHDEAMRQLQAYFRGELRDFALPLDPAGTPFQLTVWEALQKVPYGSTMSYGQLAYQIGHPKAVRAVGAANGRNPIPIVIPCHRVIGRNGTLTGYGGGLAIKRALLELEIQTDPTAGLELPLFD